MGDGSCLWRAFSRLAIGSRPAGDAGRFGDPGVIAKCTCRPSRAQGVLPRIEAGCPGSARQPPVRTPFEESLIVAHLAKPPAGRQTGPAQGKTPLARVRARNRTRRPAALLPPWGLTRQPARRNASAIKSPLAGCGKMQCLRSTCRVLTMKLSSWLPEIALQAGFCIDFVGFCQARADSGHGYATAPTSLGSRTRL